MDVDPIISNGNISPTQMKQKRVTPRRERPSTFLRRNLTLDIQLAEEGYCNLIYVDESADEYTIPPDQNAA